MNSAAAEQPSDAEQLPLHCITGSRFLGSPFYGKLGCLVDRVPTKFGRHRTTSSSCKSCRAKSQRCCLLSERGRASGLCLLS